MNKHTKDIIAWLFLVVGAAMGLLLLLRIFRVI